MLYKLKPLTAAFLLLSLGAPPAHALRPTIEQAVEQQLVAGLEEVPPPGSQALSWKTGVNDPFPTSDLNRRPVQMRLLAEVVLPSLVISNLESRRIELSVLGSATGEEVATVAAVVLETFQRLKLAIDPSGKKGWQVIVQGIEVSGSIHQEARRRLAGIQPLKSSGFPGSETRDPQLIALLNSNSALLPGMLRLVNEDAASLKGISTYQSSDVILFNAVTEPDPERQQRMLEAIAGMRRTWVLTSNQDLYLIPHQQSLIEFADVARGCLLGQPRTVAPPSSWPSDWEELRLQAVTLTASSLSIRGERDMAPVLRELAESLLPPAQRPASLLLSPEGFVPYLERARDNIINGYSRLTPSAITTVRMISQYRNIPDPMRRALRQILDAASPEDIAWAVRGMRLTGGLEEPQITIGAAAQPAGLPGFNVIPVGIRHEGRATTGRAVIFDPAAALIRQTVNPAVTGAGWNWQTIRTSPTDQHPGVPLASIVGNMNLWGELAVPPGARLGLAMHSLQTNFWEAGGFLVENGRLVVIPGVAWPADPWVFSLDAGNLGLRQLTRDAAGVPEPGALRNAIAGPVLLRGGVDLSANVTQYTADEVDPNSVRWDPATTTAAFSAIGRTANNQLIAFSLAGTPDLGVPQASIRDVVRIGLALGAVDLMLLGGSMDVQQWVAGDSMPGILGRHNNPPHDSGRRLNAALLLFQAPDPSALPPPQPVAPLDGAEATRRAAAIARNYLVPEQLALDPSADDNTWAGTLIGSFASVNTGALDAARQAGVVSPAPYRRGPFSRNELSGANESDYLNDEWLTTVRRVLDGVARQLSTQAQPVTAEDLGLSVIEELMAGIFYARRGTDNQLFLGERDESEFYRWAYREIPRLFVPLIAPQRITVDPARLTEALENPLKLSNDESNAAVRAAIDQLLRDRPDEFTDDPARLQADPELLRPWLRLVLATNLLDYSRESILREIEQIGIIPYLLPRIFTPFLTELGGEAAIGDFIQRTLAPNAVLADFPDNNGQTAASAKLVEVLQSANPSLKVYMVAKADNGVMNDSSAADVAGIIAPSTPDVYTRLRQYQSEGRFVVLAGPRSAGTPLDDLPADVIAALQQATVVLGEGEANTWSLRGLQKELFLALRLKWPDGVRLVFGLDLAADIAAQRPPAFLHIPLGAAYYNNPYDVPGFGAKVTIRQIAGFEETPAGLEQPLRGYEVETFLQRFADQAARVPAGTAAVAMIPASQFTLYRPETIASDLGEFVEIQRREMPSLPIDLLPLPGLASELRPSSLIVWDSGLGEMPYVARTPTIEHRSGEPFAYSLSQMISIALFGAESTQVRLLSVWTFDVEGTQYLAFALSA